MKYLCHFEFDGLGTKCTRCGCWTRGTTPPECPPYITRMEPNNARLPHLTAEQNQQACKDYFARLDRVNETIDRK